jgi:hypothetical protein
VPAFLKRRAAAMVVVRLRGEEKSRSPSAPDAKGGGHGGCGGAGEGESQGHRAPKARGGSHGGRGGRSRTLPVLRASCHVGGGVANAVVCRGRRSLTTASSPLFVAFILAFGSVAMADLPLCSAPAITRPGKVQRTTSGSMSCWEIRLHVQRQYKHALI